MKARERFLEALLFGRPDRVPLEPGWPRESTVAAWREQGMPADTTDFTGQAYRLAGGREKLSGGGDWCPVDQRMIPWFTERVIERREHTQIVQDWKGNICEIGNEFTVRHLREAIDFVTRRWIKCPVENRADWTVMMKRYDPNDPVRIGNTGARNPDIPLSLNFNGPFWQLREWLGFERLCELLAEDPGFVGEMIEFWREFVARLLERALKVAVPDCVRLSEDMAFKLHAMISPRMGREFLLPSYKRWGRIIRDAGVPLYIMDSDGYADELIPVWIEGGINVLEPMEVAAGNDLPALRKKYGHAMAFRGGVDKRAIAKGGTSIEEEIKRLVPVIKDGGYIPGCDHGVPPDVSWPDFVRYVGLLASSTGWL
jgi:uroporphyrinogen decarboxylase